MVKLDLAGIDGRNSDDMLQIDIDNSELSVGTHFPLLDNFGATEYDN